MQVSVFGAATVSPVNSAWLLFCHFGSLVVACGSPRMSCHYMRLSQHSLLPYDLNDYYSVVLGALSLHAALLECLVLTWGSPSILFYRTIWVTIILSFWEPCPYMRLSYQSLSLRVALSAFLSAWFRSQRLWLCWTIPLAVRCSKCRLLHMGSSFNLEVFGFVVSFCGPCGPCGATEDLLLFNFVHCFRVWSAVSNVVGVRDASCTGSLVNFPWLLSTACGSYVLLWLNLQGFAQMSIYSVFDFCLLSDCACLSLVGWLATTPLLSLTRVMSTVNCLLPGLQLSMYSEPKGSYPIVLALARSECH